MDRSLRRAVLGGGFALMLSASACGEDHNPPLDDDVAPDAASGVDVDASTTPAGPVVQVLSPAAPAAGDYSSDAILVTSRFEAVCRVRPNETTGTPVDAGSILLSATAGEVRVEAAATASDAADEYVATLDLGEVANGPVAVRCAASDLATEPLTNDAEIATFMDLGPRIEVLSPIDDGSYGQQVDVAFAVTELPVASDDDGAAIDQVTLVVGGTPIPVTDTGGGNYFATVLFAAPEFIPPLDGQVSIQVGASNSRAGSAVARSVSVDFVADAEAPAIEVVEPDAGVLVSGFIDIEVQVSDPAGIARVVATMEDIEFDLAPIGGGTFVAGFDTRLLSQSTVFPHLQVRVEDTAGNSTTLGRSVALDNRAPLLALDSPPMRDALCVTDGSSCQDEDPRVCSRLFDPLGRDAADDGEVVAALIEVRVRTEDLGNVALAPSGVYIPRAGVDPDSVEIYLLDDAAGALLVDTDSDGVCDSINPALVPSPSPDTPNEAAVLSLVPVQPAGNAHFAASLEPYGSTDGIDDGMCQAPTDEPAPPALCSTSPLTDIIASAFDDLPAIFSVPPVGGPQCVGNAFDAPATSIADGWACAAALGRDSLGNEGVSPALRICIDSNGDGLDGDGTSLADLGCGVGDDGEVDFGDIAPPEDRPACTDGCTPPQSFGELPSMQVRTVGVL